MLNGALPDPDSTVAGSQVWIQSVWGVAEAAFPTSLQVRHGYKGVLERDRRRFQIPPASLSHAQTESQGPTSHGQGEGGSLFREGYYCLGWEKYHQETSLRARYRAAGIA